MTALRLYLDEDVHAFIADALRLRGYEAIITRDHGRLGANDTDQLTFIQRHGYALLTYNVNDFPHLHFQWLAVGKHHPGIIIASRENPSQNIRALLNLLSLVSAEDLADQLEYLNFWT